MGGIKSLRFGVLAIWTAPRRFLLLQLARALAAD